MDSKKQVELIKLSTIGCISEDDQESLNSLMTEDENFLWKELGEFQNLVALLPSALVVEAPNWELKDKVARKLYRLRDEIKTKKEEIKPVEEPDAAAEQLVEESEDGISFEENVTTLEETDLVKAPPQRKISDEPVPETKPRPAETKSKGSIDRELVEKTAKEYISTAFLNEIKSTEKNLKKSFLLSLIMFVIALLLIAFMYFKFSADLDSKQEEIDVIKKRLGISHLESKAGQIPSI